MTVDIARLDRAFNPRSIAVVGDKGRYRWLRSQSDFVGKLYSVQVNPEDAKRIEDMGIQNYPSLIEIPDPVDLAIVAVPRAVAPKVIDDCIAKGVAGAELFTSGMSETGTEEGMQTERLIAHKARQSGIAIIGPNCMGIFNPAIGLKNNQEQYSGVSGPVGFISQSGTHAVNFSIEAHVHGVDINKSVSFGNGTVLDSSDYLEYFGRDCDIKFIGMYLEGVRDGHRFVRTLRQIAALKPVVIWKGGRTEGGARAISSHTASLAVPIAVWDSMVRQCGALTVESMDELIDTLNVLICLSEVKGSNTALVGGSGGQSVAIADDFVGAGLRVPELSPESYDKLNAFFRLVGAGCRNPIDPGSNRGQLSRILEVLNDDPNVDNIVLVTSPDILRSESGYFETFVHAASRLKERTQKPVLAVVSKLTTANDLELSLLASRSLRAFGIPSMPSYPRAARALRNAFDYYRCRQSQGGGSAGLPFMQNSGCQRCQTRPDGTAKY